MTTEGSKDLPPRPPLSATMRVDPHTEYKVVHREQVANPAPLGLLGFGLTTALLQGANTAITDGTTNTFTYAMAFAFGGLAQLLAGMWEFKRQNTFGAAAFSSYGAFWLSFGTYAVLVGTGTFPPSHDGEKMYLALWGILTFIFMVATLELNIALFTLFSSLSLLYFVLCGGVAATVWTRIGGWLGLFVAGVAVYIAAADIINEQYKRTVLPLGRWSAGQRLVDGLHWFIGKIPLLGPRFKSVCEREDAQYLPSRPPVDEEEGRSTYARNRVLHGNESIIPNAYEGAAVQWEQKSGTLASAVGPF